MKKTLKLLLVGTLFITLMNFATVPTFSQASSQATIQATSQATSQAAISFSDISGHWAEKAILQAVQKGYVDGYPDGTFKPDGKVSRAELIKMVVTALKLTHGPAGDHWYDTYVNAAVSNQIYQYDFTGDLNNSMTRQELSIIGVRATREDIRNEKDFELKRFMFEATKTGIVQGLGNGELGIDQTTTRAQAVTIIERLLNINSGGKEKVDKYAVSSAEIAWHKTNIFSMLPDIFDKKTANGKNAIDVWNGNDMGLKTDNGLFSGALDSIVVIDLADKKDPNWSLVPANLTWFSFHKEYPVRDYSDGYLILPQMHI
ncbi:MAG: hypothetical protein JWM44_2242, partial [Bacilli bacterium]|nr:hypothetical protein [Bacilli bacterium]